MGSCDTNWVQTVELRVLDRDVDLKGNRHARIILLEFSAAQDIKQKKLKPETPSDSDADAPSHSPKRGYFHPCHVQSDLF